MSGCRMMFPPCVPLVLLHPLPFPLLMSAVQASASPLTNPNVILLQLIVIFRYLRCCPECRSLRRSRQSGFKSVVFYNLQNLSSFFRRKSPRVVMFGPGLECDARGLVRQLLHDHTSPFEIMGMFPGQFDGKLDFHFLIITFIWFVFVFGSDFLLLLGFLLV